jgi:hypothetical protein
MAKIGIRPAGEAFHQTTSLSSNKWYPLAEKQPPSTSAPRPDNQTGQLEGNNKEAMLQVEQRRRTFRDAPSLRCEGKSLASSGFYYAGRGDVVVCAYCRGEIHRKKLGNDLTSGHMKFFPNCNYVRIQSSRTGDSCDEESGSDDGVDQRRSNEINDNIQALADQIAQLKAENERLRRAKLCLICHSDCIGAILLPCRHLVTCKQCSQTATQCPQCSATVQGKVYTYFA